MIGNIIKMKMDNGNIIPLRIYKKCTPRTLTNILTPINVKME